MNESSLVRRTEPELMDEADQARAYAEADFADVNARFVDDLLAFVETLPDCGERFVDLGCGPADICVRLVQRSPSIELVAADGAASMLAHARTRIATLAASERERIELVQVTFPDREAALAPRSFDGVISNSLLHHLHDPAVFWAAVDRLVRPGGVVYVVDLRRPADQPSLDALVDAHSDGQPDVLQRDFRASLHAAFTPSEVRAQLAAHPRLRDLDVRPISDRHLEIRGVVPD